MADGLGTAYRGLEGTGEAQIFGATPIRQQIQQDNALLAQKKADIENQKKAQQAEFDKLMDLEVQGWLEADGDYINDMYNSWMDEGSKIYAQYGGYPPREAKRELEKKKEKISFVMKNSEQQKGWFKEGSAAISKLSDEDYDKEASFNNLINEYKTKKPEERSYDIGSYLVGKEKPYSPDDMISFVKNVSLKDVGSKRKVRQPDGTFKQVGWSGVTKGRAVEALKDQFDGDQKLQKDAQIMFDQLTDKKGYTTAKDWYANEYADNLTKSQYGEFESGKIDSGDGKTKYKFTATDGGSLNVASFGGVTEGITYQPNVNEAFSIRDDKGGTLQIDASVGDVIMTSSAGQRIPMTEIQEYIVDQVMDYDVATENAVFKGNVIKKGQPIPKEAVGIIPTEKKQVAVVSLLEDVDGSNTAILNLDEGDNRAVIEKAMGQAIPWGAGKSTTKTTTVESADGKVEKTVETETGGYY